jgi:hypothetical protein
MKSKVVLLFVTLLANCMLFAQDSPRKDYIWKYQGKDKEHTIGLFAGLNGGYNELLGKSATLIGYKAGVVFDRHWAVGFGGQALNFDHSLNELVQDGTYRLEGGYSGMFVEYLVPMGRNFKAGISILSGMGVAQYRYTKDFAENRPWYQEIIDTETFAVFEPSVDFQARIAGKWWIGLYGSYRNTSPIKLMGTDENFLNTFNAGVSLTYGVF